MTLLHIAQLGRPVLLREAAPIDDPSAPEIQRLIDDMAETLADCGGAGLAAPQVHRSVRLALALPLDSAEDDREIEPLTLINPVLETDGEELELGLEGCLSVSGLRGLVPRSRAVFWRALDRDGRTIEGRAEGMFARILQHEVDHLDGVLFHSRMVDWRHLAFETELERLAESEWWPR